MEPITNTAAQVAEIAHEAATALPHESIPMTQDANFWIAASFAIFALLFAYFLIPMITRWLDSRASQIREQLEQASRLREQAQELLASYQAEREAKMKEAEAVLLAAQKEAETLRNQAAQELRQALERRGQQAIAKIARAEQDATNDIRTQMINVASQAAADVIKTELSDTNIEDPAITRALTAIEQQIH